MPEKFERNLPPWFKIKGHSGVIRFNINLHCCGCVEKIFTFSAVEDLKCVRNEKGGALGEADSFVALTYSDQISLKSTIS